MKKFFARLGAMLAAPVVSLAVKVMTKFSNAVASAAYDLAVVAANLRVLARGD